MIGSFLLGAIMVVGTQTQVISETARIALTVGVMGGFYSRLQRSSIRSIDSPQGEVDYGFRCVKVLP